MSLFARRAIRPGDTIHVLGKVCTVEGDRGLWIEFDMGGAGKHKLALHPDLTVVGGVHAFRIDDRVSVPTHGQPVAEGVVKGFLAEDGVPLPVGTDGRPLSTLVHSVLVKLNTDGKVRVRDLRSVSLLGFGAARED